MAEYKRLGDYILFEKEFECSLFSSWRAGQVIDGRVEEHVRMDILAPDLCKNANLSENWLGHTVSAAKLDHPNLLKEKTAVLDGNLVAIYPFQESYCMESLFEKSKNEGIPFSVDHALLIAGKMASALAYGSKAHQPHALVLPAFINVSAEGDLKMRGFAISHGLREHLSAHPELMEAYGHYFPRPEHLGDGGLERYAVFSVGSLLFEMLTGESFYAQGKVSDARMRVSEAEALATDGPIPDAIADIVCRAIDPHIAKSFENSPGLNTDLEQLLFSGEYSPTTFNLAFFMHSAFRDEVERRAEAMKQEKTLSLAAEEATPPPATSASQTAAAQATQPSVTVPPTSASAKTEGGSSNKGIIFGIVGAVVVIAAVGVFFILGGNKDDAEKKRLEQEQQLLQSQLEAKKQSESLKDKRKDIEIEILKEKLRQQMEDMIKENARLDEEMRAAEEQVDERAQELAERLEAERKANEEKMAEMQAKIEEMQKQKEAEEERLRLEAEAEQAKKNEADTVADSTEEGGMDSSGTSSEASTNPVPVSADSQPAAKTPPPRSNLILPHSMMDNATELDKAINQQNFYTPSRKAITAGILKSGKYYAYSFNVVIDEQGNTAECNIDQNPLAHLENDFGMAKRAQEWATRLKYKPPMKNGLPSKCKKLVLIHFRVL